MSDEDTWMSGPPSDTTMALRELQNLMDHWFIYIKSSDTYTFNAPQRDGNPAAESIDLLESQLKSIIVRYVNQGQYSENEEDWGPRNNEF